MVSLAENLSGELQTPVIDATGLTAKYDSQLSWSFDENNSARGEGYRPALSRASRWSMAASRQRDPVDVRSRFA
jgi:uncharacterized protein (TIGR03435 family)